MKKFEEKVKSEIYLSRNEDGFVCAYDKETHKCVDVILSTGDNVDLYNKMYTKYLGQVDPAFKK